MAQYFPIRDNAYIGILNNQAIKKKFWPALLKCILLKPRFQLKSNLRLTARKGETPVN
jgi:hypothetical protein